MLTIPRSLRPRFIFFALFFITIAFISWVISIHQGPHGGIVKKADTYFIEMNLGGDGVGKKMYTYLLDNKLKTISNKYITSDVQLFFSDSTRLTIELKPSDDDSFTGEMPSGFYTCKITFKLAGKEVCAQFTNQTQLVIKK